jgi:UDP-hydrolysing UDP-N-acetyl-D-glucosamine 2-epimerase
VHVTTCRSDYGPCRWLLRDLAGDPRLRLSLVVGGAHLSTAHGLTVREIEADGLEIAARLDWCDGGETEAGRALTLMQEALRRLAPSVVVLYGDRHELLPIATACMLERVPLAHLCGGDVTEGALDEQVRHALTKMAHLHLTTSERSAERVRQMGEEPWRVQVVGDPSIDCFLRDGQATLDELESVLGLVPDRRTVLVTLHPATLHPDGQRAEVEALVEVLLRHQGQIVVTAPAPDPGHEALRARLLQLAATHPGCRFVESLGGYRYRGLLSFVGAMVGNSSSGLSEAPAVGLPVVNVGRRQAGRDRGDNVIDVASGDAEALERALARALDPSFGARLRSGPRRSPYGDGHASARIVDCLAELPARSRLLGKRFVERRPPRPTVQPIGGDPPWLTEELSPGRGALFAAGRDALLALGRSRRGRWLVPDFTCPVVPAALRAAGCDVVAVPWHDPWHPELESLAELLPTAAALVVPHYLGRPPDERLWSVVEDGQFVVEDWCQVPHLPEGRRLRGSAAIGSLRKWLPLPDGAYCLVREGAQPRPGPTGAARMVALRAAGALAKAAPEASPAIEEAWLTLLGEGERAAHLDGAEPRRASLRAEALWAWLEAGEPTWTAGTGVDAGGFGVAGLDAAARGWDRGASSRAPLVERSARRLRNQRFVLEQLRQRRPQLLPDGLPSLSTTDEGTEAELLLALPLLLPGREAVRRRLAAAAIYCPIHWADGDWSGRGGAAARWAADELSLPVDDRLELDDCARLIEVLLEAT